MYRDLRMSWPAVMPALRRGRFTHPRRAGVAAALALCALLGLPITAVAMEATSTATAPLIAIDPGHGGPYSNANANGLKEKNVNLAVSLALREHLTALGYRVVMTRERDHVVQLGDIPTWNYRSRDGSWHYYRDGVTGVDGDIPEDDLQARADIANIAGADLFISVHTNGAYSRSARGFETFASRRDARGVALSAVVQRSVVRSTGLRDRGAQTQDFFVCRWTNMPAILVETGFVTNPYDAALLKDPAFRSRIAEGIARGIDEWFATRPYSRVYRRYGGATPDAFAAAISRTRSAEQSCTVVIARSDRWSEVPGAVTLARSFGGPLLWTDASALPTATACELERLRPGRVIVIGTDATLASMPSTDIAVAASIDTSAVAFIGGATSSALSGSIAATIGPGPRGVVYITSTSTPRAGLAASAVAAATGAPLLLATSGRLAPEAERFLADHRSGIRRVILVGTAERVPASLATGLPYARYSAGDLPTLAGILNAARFKDRTPSSAMPIVADGRHAPEYLTSALRAAWLDQPLLPAEGRVMPAKTREWITNHRSVTAGFEIHNARFQTPYLLDHIVRKADYL